MFKNQYPKDIEIIFSNLDSSKEAVGVDGEVEISQHFGSGGFVDVHFLLANSLFCFQKHGPLFGIHDLRSSL